MNLTNGNAAQEIFNTLLLWGSAMVFVFAGLIQKTWRGILNPVERSDTSKVFGAACLFIFLMCSFYFLAEEDENIVSVARDHVAWGISVGIVFLFALAMIATALWRSWKEGQLVIDIATGDDTAAEAYLRGLRTFRNRVVVAGLIWCGSFAVSVFWLHTIARNG